MSPVAIIFIGLVPAQLAGASTYLKAKGSRSPRWSREWVAASVAGLVTTLVASPIYLVLGLHKQLAGGSSWGASVFLAACFGIYEGALGRGRPLQRKPPTDPDDFWPSTLEEGDKGRAA